MSEVTFHEENYEFNEAPAGPPNPEFKFKYTSEDQITRIVKQVKRDKQKQRDEELWEDYCTQNTESPITGSYVIKDNYPSIILPHNSSRSSLFKSGAITIITSESLNEKISETSTNITDDILKTIEEKTSEESGIVLEINDAITEENSEEQEIDVDGDDGKSVAFKTDITVRSSIDFPENESEQEYSPPRSEHESVHITKLRMLRRKINVTLDGIKVVWELFPTDNSDEDPSRRLKRAVEFGSRFSRNYIYNLGRQMAELRKLLKNVSPQAGGQHTQHQAICQKLANAHTILLQGLQAYHKHLPTSVPGGIPDKLRDFLKHACDLWRLCNKYEILKPVLYSPGRNEVFIEDIDSKCKMLLQKIRQQESTDFDVESIYTLNSQSTIMPKFPQTPKKAAKLEKKKKKTNRLSMYAAENIVAKPQQALWKRSLMLAKQRLEQQKQQKLKKLQAKPEAATAEALVDDIGASSNSQDSVHIRKKKPVVICDPPREDDIVTQIELLGQQDSQGTCESLSHTNDESNSDPEKTDSRLQAARQGLTNDEFHNSLRPLLLEILHNIDNNKEKLENDKVTMAELKNILTEIKHVTVLDSAGNRAVSDGDGRKPRSRTTCVGPKNAKLICLSPVNSDHSPDSEPKQQTVATNTSDLNLFLNLSEQCTKSDNKSQPDAVSPIPISTPRFKKKPKPPKTEKKLKKLCILQSVIRSVNKYKDQYFNYTRRNSMYTAKKNKKPWDIVSRISDIILDEILLSVTKEVDMDRYLFKLYEMEFK